jgi:murein tripeptide amidase MpaA
MRWIVILLVLLAAVVAAVGAILGFTAVRSISEEAAPPTPSVSTALPPAATPTAGGGVLPDATPLPTATAPPASPPPTALDDPATPTPRLFFEGPWQYGRSAGGRPLWVYRFGTGPSARAIIGGIHGGYEWNTVVLVSETLKYLQDNPALLPDAVTLYVVPCANPDGYAAGTDREVARMNGNGVDLNRNWDYQWQETATHGTRPVNAGTGPFSEPETAALRDLILNNRVEAAIFYHSANARIFHGLETERSATYELAQAVSEVTGYPVAASMPGQITTGDAVDWMSAEGLAGIEVELTTHEDIEWDRNLDGLKAFLNWALPAPASSAPAVVTTQIGTSVEGRPLEVTRVGSGDRVALAIVGSIHGDETNTEALVRALMAQFVAAPEQVPDDFTVHFLPAMNPDGIAASTRQNAHSVDLNRNFPTDDWQADAARTSGIVAGSGGIAPGSEPEVQAVVNWLREVVQPGAQEVWLLSYHSRYPPDGSVQPGYTVQGTPGARADELARRVADSSGYTYLSTWPSDLPFTGELIHWCDLNGIWSADVELPTYDAPDVVPAGKSETTLETHWRVLARLLGIFAVTGDMTVIHHTVQEGDTLLGIAIEYDVDVDVLMGLNQITDPDAIAIGQTLRIRAY